MTWICPGCGETVEFDPKLGSSQMREPSGEAAGRVTFRVGAEAVHQCADGTYLPPDHDHPAAQQ